MNKDSTVMAQKVKLKQFSIGLLQPRAIIFLILWYIFSAITLFLNKYILTYRGADPYVLCGSQMFITMLCGLFQLKYPLGTYKPVVGERKPDNFAKNMIIIGFLQLGTIMFGLVALYFVAVSFAETVKSSAPIFTVLITRIVIGDPTSVPVICSLIPIMFGLFVCSSHELSFSPIGFACAMTTNLCECLQSVVSKRLFSDKTYSYSPAQLQFYPNLFGVVLQFPMWILLRKDAVRTLDVDMIGALLMNGLAFHGQTITAYVLISYISPVTYSVANTAKRACLIWFSILIFGNPITLYSAIGTLIVIGGVLVYNKTKEWDDRWRKQFSILDDKFQDVR